MKSAKTRRKAEGPERFLKERGASGARFLRRTVLFSALGALCLAAGAWFLSSLVNAAVFGRAGLTDILPLAALMVSFYAARPALLFLAERSAFRGAQAVKEGVRSEMLAQVRAAGPLALGGERTGALINAATGGVEALQGYYAHYLPSRLTAALVPLILLVCIFPADWVSGVLFIATAPLIPLFMVLIGKGAERLNQKQWRRMNFMSGYFLDMIQGLPTLKLFGAGRRQGKKIGAVCEDFRRDTMAVLRIAFLSSLTLEFFSTLSIAIVAVLIGFRLLWGDMTFQDGFFTLLLAPEFYLPLRRMGAHYHERMEAIGAAEKIQALIEGKPDGSENGPAPRLAAQVARKGAAPPVTTPSIRFEDVSFAYPGGPPALSCVSFTMRAGAHTALIGASGCGKSTILSLILGFAEPQSGRIYVGDAPLSALDLDAWRKSLCWMPQKPHLFTGSVRDNIAVARPGADEGEIDGILKSCGMGGCAALMLGEGGAGLSGGQIQRVALARALLRPGNLFLMDEPTAHLDLATERVAAEAIDVRAQGKTRITAAHRLETIRNAGQIIVLNRGRVTGQGRHEELMRTSRYYAASAAKLEGAN